MGFIKKIIKAIKTWWFERQLKKNYVPDTYVYEDDEIFEPIGWFYSADTLFQDYAPTEHCSSLKRIYHK